MHLSCNQQALWVGHAPPNKSYMRVCRCRETVMGGIPALFSRVPYDGFSSPPSLSAQRHQRSVGVIAELKGKGFGKKNVAVKKNPAQSPAFAELAEGKDKSQEKNSTNYDEEDSIPEVVTNRMLKRIALTVGVPLAIGVLFFPLFYYLRTILKWDVPEWLPLLVSLTTFGTAGFGITYGVVSTSWDPAREGSVLGWKEAKVNWPLIWEKTLGKDD